MKIKSKKGTENCPRLAVFKSNRHIYIQAIDDVNAQTLCSYSSRNIAENIKKKNEQSIYVGKKFGQKLLDLNINTGFFDRAGFLYHGRIKNLADAIRSSGIKF